jgi:hypothetical protein
MKLQPKVYELKVTLEGIRPPIWRRFRVRDDITLEELHDLLQEIMGWTNSHLHQFVVGGTYYGHRDPELPPRQDEKKVLLRQVLEKPKDRLIYEYDFGDSWEHRVVLEQMLAHEPRARYPVVLAGKRACPPEDCGGVPGYYRLLEVLAAPRHPEHRDMVEWVGGSFDAESFDMGALNRALRGGAFLSEEASAVAPRGKTWLQRQTTLRLVRKPGRR